LKTKLEPERMNAPATGAQLHHQNELNAGRFLIQRCTACARAVYFPREVCPHCGSTSLAWEAPKGLGTAHAVTTVKRKPDDGGDFNVSLVELDEGVRLMSRVEGLPAAEVHMGLRVQAYVQVDGGKGLVLFRATPGAGA
jgi:uncharacterized OB-fold protein